MLPTLILSLLPASSIYKDPSDYIDPTGITQNNLPIARLADKLP